jgi:hypothetical protein
MPKPHFPTTLTHLTTTHPIRRNGLILLNRDIDISPELDIAHDTISAMMQAQATGAGTD